jgi:hypothetical protein
LFFFGFFASKRARKLLLEAQQVLQQDYSELKQKHVCPNNLTG